jgi:hypothetical protein
LQNGPIVALKGQRKELQLGGIMKTLFFTLTASIATFVLFPAAIAGESLVALPHVSEPANMLIFGIGLFLFAKVAQK